LRALVVDPGGTARPFSSVAESASTERALIDPSPDPRYGAGGSESSDSPLSDLSSSIADDSDQDSGDDGTEDSEANVSSDESDAYEPIESD
jgi:hypothetical protein